VLSFTSSSFLFSDKKHVTILESSLTSVTKYIFAVSTVNQGSFIENVILSVGKII